MGNRRGFSLIEIMVVVVIIGILAAMAIPRYNVTAHRGKEKEADMVLSQVFRLQEAYRSQHGSYATLASELETMGFKEPTNLRYYTWGGSIILPVCMTATGPWQSRKVTLTGDIENC